MHATILNHKGFTSGGEFSADGRFVLTGCSSTTIGSQARLWEGKTGRPASEWIALGAFDHTVSIGFSPCGDKFLTGGQDRFIRIHDTCSGTTTAAFAMKSTITAAIWSPNGESLIVACQNKSLQILSASTGEPHFAKLKVARAPVSKGHAESLQVSPDNRWLAVVAGLNITLIDMSNGTLGPTLKHRLRVTSFVWRDRNRLITASDDYILREWQISAGTPSREIYRTPRWIWTLQSSRDGKRLLIGTEDVMLGDGHCGHAEVIDVDSGKPLTDWLRHDGTTLAVFSPDESRIATGSSDLTVAIWDVRSGKLLYRYRHGSMVRGIRFNRAGDRLLVIGGLKAAILKVPKRRP